MNVQTSGIADMIRERFPKVSKAPLYGPDGLKTPFYGLWRMDTFQSVGPGSVSARYVPHRTEDVIALVEAAEGIFGEIAKVDLGFHDGHYLSITPTDQQRLAVFETDTVWPRLIITARFGECFRASMGLFRDVCKNLHVMHKVHGTTATIRHTSSLPEKMDALRNDFSLLRGGWDALAARIQQMDALRVNTAEFLNQMYPLAHNATRNVQGRHQQRTEAIIRRIARERLAVGRESSDLDTATAWELWNGVGGYVQHDKSRRGYSAGFNRAILAMEDTALERAENILMAMAV